MKTITIFGPSKRFLSGVSYYTIRLSNALSELFHVNTILFRNMLPKRLFPGWKRVGKNLTNLEFNKNVRVYELLDWYNPLTWIKAYRIAEKSNAIILQWWTSSVSHMYLFVESMNKISEKIPVIIEFHEVVDPLENSILPIKVYSRIMGRLVRRFASHYVVHSKADLELISKTYSIPEENITVIPHGIYDHYPKLKKGDARKALGIEDEFVILFFGLLRPYKGVKYLIKAFESLPEEILKRSKLLIVGETWEDRESVTLAKKSKHSERILLVNRYVADDELPLYFSAADVVVLPYTRASQSGVAHIAMTFGLPVVATKVGGLLESLGAYSGTIFVEPCDSDSIKSALIRVFNHREQHSPPDDYRWEKIALKWSDLLSSL